MSDAWKNGFESSFLDAAKSASTATLFQTALPFRNVDRFIDLTNRLDAECRSAARVACTTKETSHALSPVQFVYMDVGCWTGDGKKQDSSESNWPMHREFGIVHGPLVLLCAYSNSKNEKSYSDYGKPSAWIESTTRLVRSPTVDDTLCDHPDWKPVGDFLREFVHAIKGLDLHILGATCVSSPYAPIPRTGENTPIRVFLGDLHAPVATNRPNAHIFESGHEMLKGRLNMGGGLGDSIAGAIARSASPLAGDLARDLIRTLGAKNELRWNETATADEIDYWLGLYHVDGKRTADIFQKAGEHLRAFVDNLAVFHEEVWPVELLQLGDFFDLWMGFQRAFGAKLKGYDAISNPLENMMEFARYWVDRSLFHSEQGPHLVHLLTLDQWARPNKATKQPLKTTFLYGNHDNYLKHGGNSSIVVPDGLEHAGQTIPAFHRPSSIEMDGVWAEHGHQCDTFNWDEDPSWGHALTQAAFVRSGMRNLEKPAGRVVAFGDGNRIQRTLSIAHAMNRCLLNHVGWQLTEKGLRSAPYAPCRGIYVMGHTHEALLKRVEVLP